MSDKKTVALEASQAQVTTATISIHTLRVGKRQLTQAIFKQLPKCELLTVDRKAEEIRFMGNVWGWVNYDLAHPSHRYFVLEIGGRLLRAEFWAAEFHTRLAECNQWARHRPPLSRHRDPSNYVFDLFSKTNSETEWLLDNDWEERWNDFVFNLEFVQQLFIAA